MSKEESGRPMIMMIFFFVYTSLRFWQNTQLESCSRLLAVRRSESIIPNATEE